MSFDDLVGRPVVDGQGRPLGHLDDLFVGRSTGRPEFGILALAGGGRVAVPLTTAGRQGDTVVVPLDPARIQAAPRVQGDVEEIPFEAGRMVHEFFGTTDPRAGEPPSADPTPTAVTTEVPAPPASRSADDTAEVVLSEEQIAVDTRMRATERVRVRKSVVEEDVTLTVTVRREELVIERLPVSAQDAAAPDEIVLGQGDVEFVLHAEEPVVTKRIVPVEKVRLHRDTITEEQHLTETVRKERVEVEELPVTQEHQP